MSQAIAKGGFWSGLTGLLAGVGVFLAVLLLVQTLMLGKRVEVEPEDRALPALDSELQQVVLTDSNNETYSSILQKPLFFPDRLLPEVVAEEGGGDEGEEEQEQLVELDARLSGVIITPDKRIAMVTDGKTSKTAVMREGMSLEGDQASWKLSEINPRKVSFAAGERTAELELKVNTRSLRPPAGASPAATNRVNNRANNRNANNNAAATQPATNNSAANSAAEVRRRIAERRAKLRAAREQQAQNQSEQDEE